MSGSRDFGAQIFTALLRSLGVETRLVFSLQPLGFNFGKAEDFHRLPRKHNTQNDDPPGDDEEDLGLPQVKPNPRRTGVDSDLLYPVFWSEVPFQTTWIAVDALTLPLIAVSPAEHHKFEPRGRLAEEKKEVMGYVVTYDSGPLAVDAADVREICQRCYDAVCEEFWSNEEMADKGVSGAEFGRRGGNV
jgi:xeroderma pigmentosum group C-complementing protein